MRSRSARWWLAVLAGFGSEVASEGVRAGAVHIRQDTLGATEVLTPTATILSSVTQSDDGPGTPSQTTLQPAETVDIADQIGLIMPSPWTSLYVGLSYTFGFVDAVRRPAPITGGWLRQVQPLLIFPDYTVNVFPTSGTSDPKGPGSVPEGGDGLCAATIEDYSMGYPFVFAQPGWYMFVINQTYSKPTIVDRKCQEPLVSVTSFFATQTISIAAQPTEIPGPVSPSSVYTVFAAVSTNLPSTLPLEKRAATRSESLIIGLSVFGALLAVVSVGLWLYWVRKKRKMEAEALAFSRLKPEEQYAFLLENPQSWLNPANQAGRHAASPPMSQAQYPAGGSGWGMFGWGMPGAGNRYWPNGGGQHGVGWGHHPFPSAQLQTPMYAPQPGSLGRY